MIDVKLFTAAAMAVCGLLATTDARAGETAGTMQSTPTPSIPGPEVIRQLQDAWGRHRILLVGETHGTMETPAVVSALVESTATRAPVVVGLEIPIEECAAIGAYLASEGSGHDRRKVTAGRFWQRTHQDGRSSAAVFGLIEDIRQFRGRGWEVALECFDSREIPGGSTNDAAMAAALRGIVGRHPGAETRFVMLVGNYHATDRSDAREATMASLIGDLAPFNMLVSSRAPGSSWNCIDRICASHEFTPRKYAGLDAASLVIHARPDANGFDAVLVFDRFTASPPMVDAMHGR